MAFLTGQTWYCGSTKWTAVTAWAATTAYTAGQLVRQLAAPTVGNERVYVCIVAGTSGGSEPTWTFTQGAVQPTDGTVTWVEVTGKAGVNGDITNTAAWLSVKSTTVSTGVIIYDVSTLSLQICSTSGAAGSGAAPTFSATAGVTTTDNTVTWTSLGLASGFGAYAAPWARLNLAWATGAFVANNDTVYVSNNHAETQTTSANYNVNLGLINLSVICVSDAAVPPTASATSATVTITSTGAINLGNIVAVSYTQGIQFISNNGMGVQGVNNRYDTCVFKLTGGTSLTLAGGNGPPFNNPIPSWDPNSLLLYNCSLIFSSSSQVICGNSSVPCFTMIGGSITSTGSMPTTLISTFSNFQTEMMNFVMKDVNLSTFTGTVLFAQECAGGTALLENCAWGAGVVLLSGTPQNPFGDNYVAQTPIVRAHNCGNTASAYPYASQNVLGLFSQTTAIFRSTGATSFTTPLAWQFATTALSSFVNPFVSEEGMAINPFTSGSHTVTFFLTSSAVLNNAQLWFEVEVPQTSGSPLFTLVRSKATLISQASTLTADGVSSWTGALAYNYKVAVTISPAISGYLKWRMCLAAPSTTVVLDPLPVLA